MVKISNQSIKFENIQSLHLYIVNLALFGFIWWLLILTLLNYTTKTIYSFFL